MTFDDLFGSGTDLTTLQMAVRALVIFFATMLMLRIAGRRAFGQRTAFDLCITVLLGAVLSRAIVGASPFVPTLAAGAMLVLLHRLIGMLGIWSTMLDDLISGTERLLVSNGVKDHRQMRKALISDKDLAEAVRKKTGDENIARVARAVLERNGEITIVPMKESTD